MNLVQRLLARLDRSTTTGRIERHMSVCRCPRMGALVNSPKYMLVMTCEGHLPVEGWTPDVCQHHAHTYAVPTKQQLFRLTEGRVVVQYSRPLDDDGTVGE